MEGRYKRSLALIASSVLVVGIFVFDYLSRWEICFSIFYILPISLVTWHYGKRTGFFFAFICALTWFLADVENPEAILHPLVPYWNTMVRLVFFIVTVMLVSVRKLDSDREKELARRDSLSALLNNRAFHDILRTEIARSGRYRHPLSLVFIDCDDFKKINDRLGHTVGDDLIKEVASEIKTSLRASDSASRLGGDEFAVLLPETGPEEAEKYAKRLQAGLDDRIGKKEWKVTFSIGVASFIEPPETPEEMINQADMLMYQAKKAGKDAIRTKAFDDKTTDHNEPA